MRLALLALGLALWSPGWSEDFDPAATVEAFHDELLSSMRSGSGFAARTDALRDPVSGFFDVATISRISLGRTWRELDAESRAEFSGLLERLIVATYANRFDVYSGQSFHTLSAQPARRGWVVRTELERSGGERIALDYYFRDGAVFDVVADGVSDLSLRRADYNSIVKSEGFDALLAHLRRKIDEHVPQGE